MEVKYLYKYIYKWPDKAQTIINPNETEKKDKEAQISEYVDARYISAIEAAWHVFHFYKERLKKFAEIPAKQLNKDPLNIYCHVPGN